MLDATTTGGSARFYETSAARSGVPVKGCAALGCRRWQACVRLALIGAVLKCAAERVCGVPLRAAAATAAEDRRHRCGLGPIRTPTIHSTRLRRRCDRGAPARLGLWFGGRAKGALIKLAGPILAPRVARHS